VTAEAGSAGCKLHSKRVAWSASVRDSLGFRHRIQSAAARYKQALGAARSFADAIRAPYRRATRSVPSVEPWSTIKISVQGKTVSKARERRKASFFVCSMAVIGGMEEHLEMELEVYDVPDLGG
jgi:hypothetical protein